MFRRSVIFGIGVLSLALLVGASQSQEKKGKFKGQIPAGWKALDLSDAQKEKIYEINAQYKAKIDDLKKKLTELTSEQKTAQVGVLTDTQKELLRKLVLGESKKKSDKKSERKPADK